MKVLVFTVFNLHGPAWYLEGPRLVHRELHAAPLGSRLVQEAEDLRRHVVVQRPHAHIQQRVLTTNNSTF